MVEEIELQDEELNRLWSQLKKLHFEIRNITKKRYNRINPFTEDLFDWKEKGTFCGGKNVTIYDSTTVLGDVKIGDYTWIGPFCSLDGTGGLKIGKYCSISAGTQLLTHDTVKYALSGGNHKYERASVKIGDCCFIGTQAIILKGTTIGNHCLIAANSLVNRDFENYSIIAGTPAKEIGIVKVVDDQVVLEHYD